MQIKRRDLLLAAGLTLVFGASANARVLIDGGSDTLPTKSTPRRLSLRHAHTGEVFNGPYRDDIGPLPDAMIDLSYFLRDHHEDIRGPLFVETLDFLADVIGNAGQSHATILSAYRTQKTNEMLATRLYGVAEKSQHLAGRAIDITLPSKLEKAAGVAKKMSRGGVGWYPQSHFIHLDSGPVRHWTMDVSRYDRIAARSEKAAGPKLTTPSGAEISVNIRPKHPLTVQDRLRLHRSLAKTQSRGRT